MSSHACIRNPIPFVRGGPLLSLIFALSFLTSVGPTRGDVVFNSFGPADAVNFGATPVFISGGSQNLAAVKFVPLSTYQLSHISVYLRSTGGNGQSSIFVSVVPDAAGVPGATPLWTSLPVIVTPGGGVYTFTSTTPASVHAGQACWVVLEGTLSAGNAAITLPGQPPAFGTHAEAMGMSAWTVFNGAPVPAVRVEGTLSGACCNRGTGGCVVLASSVCATLGLRFDGNGSACTPAACRACPGDFNRSGAVSTQDLFDFLAAFFTGCP